MSLMFCCDIQRVGSEFSVNDMKALIHPASYHWFMRMMYSCGGIFYWCTLAICVFRSSTFASIIMLGSSISAVYSVAGNS